MLFDENISFRSLVTLELNSWLSRMDEKGGGGREVEYLQIYCRKKSLQYKVTPILSRDQNNEPLSSLFDLDVIV